jgi:hypothetical protein
MTYRGMKMEQSDLSASLQLSEGLGLEPVAWVKDLTQAQPHCVTHLRYCSISQHDAGLHLKYIPLYTADQVRAAVAAMTTWADEYMTMLEDCEK